MTVRAADLSAEAWEVFDEFVLRLGGDDDWDVSILALRHHYVALMDAGLLALRPNYALEMYGLTVTGRREVCSRDGHEFNLDRPAAEGCKMCDAVVCPDCYGFGRFPKDSAEAHGEGGISGPDCTRCDQTGLVERG